MNKATLTILAALSTSITLADDFKTIDGKEYKNAKVNRVEPDGIVIKFSGGIVKISFTELSPEIQKKYGYDSQAAGAYSAQQNEQQAALARQRQADEQQAKEKADAARKEQLATALDERQTRQAERTVEGLLIYAIIKPYRFSKNSTHATLRQCYRTITGRHNEGLNVVDDYAWEPNPYVKEFDAVIDEPMPGGIGHGDAIPVALYKIGYSDDSSRLPRFTLLREKAIRFVLTGAPR